MPTQMKPILNINNGQPSRSAIAALNSVGFPHVIDPNPEDNSVIPSLSYNNLTIRGLENIQKAANKYASLPDLDKIFTKPKREKTSVENSRFKSSKLSSKDMLAATIGFLFGGLWIIVIDMFVQLSPIMQVVLLLFIPAGIYGWPYYWPYIKAELKKSRKS